ncbi:MAG TPA: S41 family peptidase, partial [Bacteroidetes bacterium]|nr:S41 family peptidase [Bacteroidota bacterium]
MSQNAKIFYPILLSIVLCLGLWGGWSLNNKNITYLLDGRSLNSFGNYSNNEDSKVRELIDVIKHRYVDQVDSEKLSLSVIKNFLKELDPHSVYIPKKEFKSSRESLRGQFEGIGIVFSVFEDTIMVINAINGGPSDKLGIRSGDKIIKVDDELVAGVNISDNDVVKMLRGEKGSKVSVSIFRNGENEFLDFDIVRDKIPIFSVDAHYMVDDQTGYIKISRFSRETYNEFKVALIELKEKGMHKLVLDLMNNSGGYLGVAVQIIDELLAENALIVYTEGNSQNKKEYFASEKGDFENGKLVVLVDEGSASASEILAGAVQDWDRGMIVGRRTFGKGLVQEEYTFSDSSALRLTVARYFTPLGRSIQKPYDKGRQAYYEEYYNYKLQYFYRKFILFLYKKQTLFFYSAKGLGLKEALKGPMGTDGPMGPIGPIIFQKGP